MSEAITAPAPAAPAASAIISPAPAAAPAPAASAAPEWLAGLPEDLRAAPSLLKFRDPAALAKSYTELEGLIGRRGAVPPKDGDPPEVAQAWRQALGVPEQPDGYEIKAPEGTPDDVWGADTSKVLASWAHELGLTPAQAQGIAERYAGMLTKHAADTSEATETELRREWGAAYERKVNAGIAAVRQFASDDARAALKAAGLDQNPHILRMLVRVGEAIGDHDGSAGMGSGGGAMTPSDARAEAARVRAHPGYFDRRHPEHRVLVQRAIDLEQMAMVGQPT